MVSLTSGKVLRTTSLPYGSFELDTGSGLVVTSSLFRGTVAVLSRQLRVLHVIKIAPVTRDVALVGT
jgi:hypothetical protein